MRTCPRPVRRGSPVRAACGPFLENSSVACGIRDPGRPPRVGTPLMRMKTRMNTSWSLALALAPLLLAVAACRKPQVCRDVVVDYSDRPVGELVTGFLVEQSFAPNHDRLSAVAVNMATYAGRARDCRVAFLLRVAGSPNVIYDKSVACSAIDAYSCVSYYF